MSSCFILNTGTVLLARAYRAPCTYTQLTAAHNEQNCQVSLGYSQYKSRGMLLFRPGHPANAPYSKVTPYSKKHMFLYLVSLS
jgi:hypothetical protein